MRPLYSVTQRPDGTWQAEIEFNLSTTAESCVHMHSTEPAALACARWESNGIHAGKSRWHAKQEPWRRVRKERLDFSKLRSRPNETVSDEEAAASHEYIPMPSLLELWHAVVLGSKKHPAANLMFLGPSGSGKTDGARDLAARVGLPFVKVDAASMTDPEAWFGTREIVVQGGVAVTEYRPSTFVEWLGKPCVLLIDEANRIRDEQRNVVIPVLDHTRQVMNPLTGEIVTRHPECFIIMTGNVGLHYTGTNAMDPAFVKRSLTVEFDYIDAKSETRIVSEAAACDEETAFVLVKFATETRAKARASEGEFLPVSTRELIEAGRLVADGLNRDLAVRFTIIEAASPEGGASSVRQELKSIWNGVRVAKPEIKKDGEVVAQVGVPKWICPVHGQSKLIPAGTSSRTMKPYNAFWACPVTGCQHTEDKTAAVAVAAAVKINGRPVKCPECGSSQPLGRTTICGTCGSSLN